jgi:AAHS family 4-hydroxybenzoate transporter-like MFS transporter
VAASAQPDGSGVQRGALRILVGSISSAWWRIESGVSRACHSDIFFAVVTLLTARVNSGRTVRFFVAGIGLGGIMPNAVALVGEYAPRRLRVLMI